jgi:hypothetical protein
MIKIHCPDKLAEAIEFGFNNNCIDKLMDKLEYLSVYNPDNKTTLHLHGDFAPLSFEFLICHEDGSRYFNGGLIYSGPGQPLDGTGPALTVGIGIDSSRHGWSIHT